MQSTLETLNRHLASALNLLRGGLNKELHSRLHNQEREVLPEKDVAELSFKRPSSFDTAGHHWRRPQRQKSTSSLYYQR
jgi:hypothetical protein